MSAGLRGAIEEGGIVLAAMVLLGSCATSRPPALSSDALAWNFYTEGSQAKLAWGRPNSDDVGLMLTCNAHSRQVMLTSDGAPGERQLQLVSDNVTSKLPVRLEKDAMSEGGVLEAWAPLADGALSAFARSGRLTLVRQGARYTMSASDSDRAAVRSFFKACA